MASSKLDPSNYKPAPLKSTEAIDLARELSRQQIEIIRGNPEFGGPIIADKLLVLRNAVWGDEISKKPLSEEGQKLVFKQTLTGLEEPQKEQLLSSYARMGHLYEIASLSARSNYLQTIAGKGEAIPGGSAEVITSEENKNKSAADMVEKFNRPVFEIVMTAHPTNVNSLASMKAQREIDKALENKDQKALTEALIKYQETPLLHQVPDEAKPGKMRDGNLTVRDETKIALYFLGNIYEDLPKVYKNYDDALANHAANTNSTYDAASLNLQMRFGSWASSGDKDGNNKVTAASTLESIALHTQAILKHYSEDIGKMNSPSLNKWKDSFDQAIKDLNKLIPEIVQINGYSQFANKTTSPDQIRDFDTRFNSISGKLAKLRNSLDKSGFANDLEDAAKKELKDDTKTDKQALNLLRRFRTFGFNFSKIEYRETAKQYERVVGEIVDGYKYLNADEKIQKLTDILTDKGSNIPSSLLKEYEDKIIKNGAGQPYKPYDADPIAYNTIKRMALARDFPDMIKDSVLAECGQVKENASEKAIISQGVANILEAQFLQHAVEKDGKRAKMGIVPLFEEPATLDHIDLIMGNAYHNKAYKQHLQTIKEASGGENTTQQIMIAHSDNARRSGLQAARAYIHIAHHKVRELSKNNPDIQTQFFEGGSISDAYRNGVRSISKSVDAFGLHDFAKFTFQGGDLLNFFNHPAAINRLFESSIAHQAKYLHEDHGKWVPKVIWSRESSPKINEKEREQIEKNVGSALRDTLADYRLNDFTQERLGVLLTALGYKNVARDSNISSRASERGGSISSGTSQIGAAAVNTEREKFVPVPIDEVRTIVFSKAGQRWGIVPGFIGSGKLRNNLDEKFYGDKKRPFTELAARHDRQDGKLSAQAIREIYDYSPTFRDAQARVAFHMAMTDMDSAIAIAGKKLGENALDSEEEKKLKKSGHDYLNTHLPKTYRLASDLAYSALTGKELKANEEIDGKKLSFRAIRDKLIDAQPHLKEDIIYKTNYRAPLLYWQINNEGLYDSLHMGRTAQLAQDTVEHGRWLGASDPSYARHRDNYRNGQNQQHNR